MICQLKQNMNSIHITTTTFCHCCGTLLFQSVFLTKSQDVAAKFNISSNENFSMDYPEKHETLKRYVSVKFLDVVISAMSTTN